MSVYTAVAVRQKVKYLLHYKVHIVSNMLTRMQRLCAVAPASCKRQLFLRGKYDYNYYLSSVVLKRVVIKALGVMFDYELSFVCYCKEKIILLQNIFYVRFHQQEFYLFNRTGICNIV